MQLVWFRNDLRLDDNPALFHACQYAMEKGDTVRAVFIACPEQWRLHDESPRKLGILQSALQSLQKTLADLGITLELLDVALFDDVPKVLLDYCQSHQANGVYFNREIPLNEKHRDEAVAELLGNHGITVQPYSDDRIIHAPLLSKQGAVYRVFTPWYKNWLSVLSNGLPEVLPSPKAPAKAVDILEPITVPGAEVFREDLWSGEENKALDQLQRFCEQKAEHYQAKRDYPSIAGTSTLSPYLAIGLLSARRCLHTLFEVCVKQGFHHEDCLNHVWARELAWRDFYRYLMLNFEHISRGENFKQEPLSRGWLTNEDAKRAWETGQTGFPIIDAAMQQLLRTGWMHNRLRMLVASFYCKLLCLDWRDGERFFMQHLVDGDFPSNNGGWQWSSSTGCDASPWFRIFNPTTQSQKFDESGDFIKRFLPELADLDSKSIHWPSQEQRLACHYPDPIIDYKEARQLALDFFKVDS
ncbi:cryptochrome/photolyase family protein [Pseudoteredinibacter isoporae]|uniref:Deoxyribodipyrimidine photo-lyase n=1 Tax=Pseudoteredinibacter isoporae TaxID=570281 RepID=A0A7X0JQT6_9GAMM|nr:FAD-binding domain-containing protein [Pseudoteredinibacter isoporae]MBB6520094.1 deoxyribodipyrimidine photo-lyase [Pseudoteredinibacter isoporae]NHO85666.1 deoxyribodipyrimidine photo-lyase [Pseudoteredinibacter isoporae]NIB25882.1 deoxyribodipyrimidine photo-lyase [Pseudoteredinibacter isoporae]